MPPTDIKGLRHAHATALLKAGTHPKVVQERLGHASIQVTLDIWLGSRSGIHECRSSGSIEHPGRRGHNYPIGGSRCYGRSRVPGPVALTWPLSADRGTTEQRVTFLNIRLPEPE